MTQSPDSVTRNLESSSRKKKGAAFSIFGVGGWVEWGAAQPSDEVRLCAGKVGAVSRLRKQNDTLYPTDVGFSEIVPYFES